MYTALLVDDERLARIQLRAQLSRFREVQVVAEADSIPQALDAAREYKPDVVFLDIQMPGHSGFDFLAKVNRNVRVIFVTAYDQFAVRAFEVNALDYLLKPVRFDRLAAAVERLIAPVPPLFHPTLARLEDSDYLFVSGGFGARFVKVSTIKYVLAAGSYSEVYTAGGCKCMLLQSIKNWEERLPGARFGFSARNLITERDQPTGGSRACNRRCSGAGCRCQDVG